MSKPSSDSFIINEETLPVIYQMAESFPGGFFIYKADGTQEFVFYNSHLPSIFGCETEDDFKKLTGNSFRGTVHPDDYAKTESGIVEQTNRNSGKNSHVSYRFIRNNGSIGMMDNYSCFVHSETLGDIYYAYIKDITVQYKEEHEHKENIARIIALEDNFVSLYDVELETGKYVNYVKSHMLSDDNVYIMVNNDDFFGDSIHNAELVIHPEDREDLLKVLTREFIMNTLQKENYFDWYYRLLSGSTPIWARLRFVYKDKDKTHAIIGIFNAEEEMVSKHLAEQKRKELIVNITGTESTYIVNPKNEMFTVLSQNKYLKEHYPSSETYTKSITRYIETDVFEPDRKTAMETLSLQNIVNHLKNEDEYVVRYRDASSGNPRWFEMRAVRLSETEILYGFSDKNNEVIGQLLADRMKKNYFGLYYVSLDAQTAQIIKTGHPDITGEAGAVVPYHSLIQNIASGSEGETVDFLNRIGDVDYLMKVFTDEDTAYYTYKSYIFEGDRWVNVVGFVLSRHEDGTPSEFALGFALLDEEASKRQDALQNASKL